MSNNFITSSVVLIDFDDSFEKGIKIAKLFKEIDTISMSTKQSEEESLECLFMGVTFSLTKPIGLMDLALCLVKCGNNLSSQTSDEDQ